MSLSDLASLGSFVSGVAVLASLVFLFFQMRQMTEQVRQTDRNQRASMQLGEATRGSDIFARMGDPAFVPIMVKAMRCEELNEVELWIWASYVNNVLNGLETSFLHHSAGLLDGMWSDDGTIRFYFSLPAFRAMWQIRRTGLRPDFRKHIDDKIESVTVFEPSEFAPLYNKTVRDQLARAKPAPVGDADTVAAEYQAR